MDGDLGVLVRSFARALPGRDSRRYRPPSDAERRSMELAFRAVLRGDLAGAKTVAADVGYDVLPYTDRTGGRDLVLLMEEDGRTRRGWGLFIHAPGARAAATVEVPHPVHDAQTEQIGVRVFQAS